MWALLPLALRRERFEREIRASLRRLPRVVVNYGARARLVRTR